MEEISITQINKKINEISQSLFEFESMNGDISLSYGTTGMSLFQLCHALTKKTLGVDNIIDKYLNYSFPILENNCARFKTY